MADIPVPVASIPGEDSQFSNVFLLSHLDGTDGSSVIVDVIGHSLTSASAVLSTTQKKFGSASLRFPSGTGNKVTTPDSADFELGAGDWTFDLWLYLTADLGSGDFIGLFGKGDPNSGQGSYRFVYNALSGPFRILQFQYCTDGDSFSNNVHLGGVDLGAGAWNFIRVTRASNVMKYAVNGSQVGSNFDVSSYTPFNGNADFYIGGSFQSKETWIDEFRFTKGVARDINELPTAPFGGGDTLYPTITSYAPNNIVAVPVEIPIPTATNRSGDTSYDNVSFLSHFDGTDGSTVITDEKGHSVTANGGAALSTSRTKFETASLLISAETDNASIPSDSSLNFGSGDFSIECWFNTGSQLTGTLQSMVICNKGFSGSNQEIWAAYHWQSGAAELRAFLSTTGSNLIFKSATWPGSDLLDSNRWYFFQLIRQGNNLKFALDGVQVGSTQDVTGITLFSGTDPFKIGGGSGGGPVGGYWFDDFRITKGVARPIALPTGPFEGAVVETPAPRFSSLNTEPSLLYGLLRKVDAGSLTPTGLSYNLGFEYPVDTKAQSLTGLAPLDTTAITIEVDRTELNTVGDNPDIFFIVRPTPVTTQPTVFTITKTWNRTTLGD